jgi:crossover junction endodeoxyribonuclease RuvC
LKILGIDPGSNVMGWALLDTEDNTPIIDILRMSSKIPIEERMAQAALKIREVIEKHQPTRAAIEITILGKHNNIESARKLYEITGAVTAMSGVCGLSVARYRPVEWKRLAVGHSQATKQNVKMAMILRFPLLTMHKAADAYDALALAVALEADIRMGKYYATSQ